MQDYCSAGRLLPIVLVKDYYYCPVQAWIKLNLYPERPTQSMMAGGLDGRGRAELLERLEGYMGARGLQPVEMLWEHEVRSCRLGLHGRADLIVVLGDETLLVVEAKLSLPPRRRRLPVLAQLAAYTIAAEETLARPARAALLYTLEQNRLHEVAVGPGLRRLVEEAAKNLHSLTGNPQPPPARIPAWRCTACSYKTICPKAHTVKPLQA